MKLFVFIFLLAGPPLLAQPATGQTGGYERAAKSNEVVSVEGTVYQKTELPFRIQNHLVLTQSGICIGFFFANSDVVYGAKTGLPIGYIAADGYLYFSFPTK
jgi:hypothetical protein